MRRETDKFEEEDEKHLVRDIIVSVTPRSIRFFNDWAKIFSRTPSAPIKWRRTERHKNEAINLDFETAKKGEKENENAYFWPLVVKGLIQSQSPRRY